MSLGTKWKDMLPLEAPNPGQSVLRVRGVRVDGQPQPLWGQPGIPDWGGGCYGVSRRLLNWRRA